MKVANAPPNVSITPSIANMTLRRFSSASMRDIGTAACGGIDGRLTHSHASVTAASGTSAQKTPRQPMTPPR